MILSIYCHSTDNTSGLPAEFSFVFIFVSRKIVLCGIADALPTTNTRIHPRNSHSFVGLGRMVRGHLLSTQRGINIFGYGQKPHRRPPSCSPSLKNTGAISKTLGASAILKKRVAHQGSGEIAIASKSCFTTVELWRLALCKKEHIS